MSDTNFRTVEAYWCDLSKRELQAARAGGPIWRDFVRRSETETGLPWSQIRKMLNHWHEMWAARSGSV